MFIPISIEDYVKQYLESNPDENEKVLRVRLEAALDDYQKGIKCQCGKDIWVIGSAFEGNGCFSCITGKKHPAGEPEIESALEKRDRYGRRHMDEMDPRDIAGIFDDDGYEINPDSIKKPSLCLTCVKNYGDDWEDEILCNLNRFDQNDDEIFICGEYEKM